MHGVRTDHKVVVIGTNEMALVDPDPPNEPIVTARRTDSGKPCVGHAEGTPDKRIKDRYKAAFQMTEHALAVLPGKGYSTLFPHGLADIP